MRHLNTSDLGPLEERHRFGSKTKPSNEMSGLTVPSRVATLPSVPYPGKSSRKAGESGLRDSLSRLGSFFFLFNFQPVHKVKYAYLLQPVIRFRGRDLR